MNAPHRNQAVPIMSVIKRLGAPDGDDMDVLLPQVGHGSSVATGACAHGAHASPSLTCRACRAAWQDWESACRVASQAACREGGRGWGAAAAREGVGAGERRLLGEEGVGWGGGRRLLLGWVLIGSV